MPSRRDQLLSYQFMVHRVISAVVYRDAELVRTPFHRAGSTFFIGAMIGVLALAITGIYGVLSPGGKKTWKNDQALIMEKETGARYIWFEAQLHPVSNYVSARLILKQSKISTISASRASLRGAPRGVTLGITGAPDSLPESKRLLQDPWIVCSRPGTNESGKTTTKSVLIVGRLSHSGRGTEDEAILATASDGAVFLIWHNYRFLVRQAQTVLAMLALEYAPVLSVPPAWLNAIPQGADIAPIDIPKRGSASPLKDALIGQVVVATSGNARQHYVVLDDGITGITPLQADMLLRDPATAVAYPKAQPKEVIRNDLAAAKQSSRKLMPASGPSQPPSTTPTIMPGIEQTSLCVSFGGSTNPSPIITVGGTLPATSSAVRMNGSGVDEIVIPSGRGAIVQSAISPESMDGTLLVVTDVGVRYPLSSKDVLGYLGFTTKYITRVPASLVALLPQGPALDPQVARSPATTG